MTTTYSIGELVAQNVLSSLNNIRRANGYELDVLARRAQTIRQPLSPANADSGQTYDAEVIIIQGDLERVEPLQTGKRDYRQTYMLTVLIYIADSDAELIPFDQRFNQIAASIDKALMADCQRGTHPDTENPLAVDTTLGAFKPMIEGSDEGFVAEVIVHYRTAENDPYSH